MGKDGPTPIQRRVVSAAEKVVFGDETARLSIGIALANLVEMVQSTEIGADETNEIDDGMMQLISKSHLVSSDACSLARDRLSVFATLAGENSQTAHLYQRITDKNRLISKDVETGLSPWLACISHNERTPLNPFITGFYQEPNGKIRTIYGTRYFRSERQIHKDPILVNRNEHKVVNLLTTQFQKVDRHEVLKSPLFDLLPPDLKSKFENGEILVTGGHDVYDIKPGDIVDMEPAGAIEQCIAEGVTYELNTGSKYFLLYYGDSENQNNGRTGVLMTAENGELKPLIIEIDGLQFILEIKGCGTKNGGFDGMQERTGRKIITGGVDKNQAINEHERLLEVPLGDGPQAVASILFDNPDGYQQGYILRLSPSTLRASYTGGDAYPTIDSAENTRRVMDMYAGELANQILGANPKIMSRSSHTENILLWGNGRHTFTDFSDHALFCDNRYPYQADESYGGFLTILQLLKFYIAMVEEIPGYKANKDKDYFYQKLQTVFGGYDISIILSMGADYEIAAQQIWESVAASKLFEARRSNHYLASGVLQNIDENKSKYQDFLQINSAEEFLASFRKHLETLVGILENLNSQNLNEQELDLRKSVLSSIEKQNFLGLIEQVNVISQILPTEALFGEDTLYFLYLAKTCFLPLKKYFASETEVLSAVDCAKFDLDPQILAKAKVELQKRTAEFESYFNSPESIFRLLQGSCIKELLTFSYYRGCE